MTQHAVITVFFVITYAAIPGCHLFDDFDKLALKCPDNSGYPCRCDPTRTEGCGDGSSCVTVSASDSFGVCSRSCDGWNDETTCADTKTFGLEGVCTIDEDGDSIPDTCVVLCEIEASNESCPKGTECRKETDSRTGSEISGCFAKEASPEKEDTDGCECSKDEYDCYDNNLRYCEDECNWITYECTDVCSDMGYDITTGCGYSADLFHDVCYCDYDDGCECREGDFECEGDDIRICIENCRWETYSCDFICADSGGYSGKCSYNPATEHDVCWCIGNRRRMPGNYTY